jgi:hypothetical protein
MVAFIVLGFFAGVLPRKFAIVTILADIAFPIVWFAGGAASAVTNVTRSGQLLIPANSGIVVFAQIDFNVNDPYHMDVNLHVYNQDADLGTFTLSVGSSYAGLESESGYLPLDIGMYTIDISADSRFEVDVRPLGLWSDISPATGIGLFRWGWLTFALFSVIVGLCVFYKRVDGGAVNSGSTIRRSPTAVSTTSTKCPTCGGDSIETYVTDSRTGRRMRACVKCRNLF